jgi:predicted small lipoprotein YifL
MRRLLTVLTLTLGLLALSACGSIVEPVPLPPNVCVQTDTLHASNGTILLLHTYRSGANCP